MRQYMGAVLAAALLIAGSVLYHRGGMSLEATYEVSTTTQKIKDRVDETKYEIAPGELKRLRMQQTTSRGHAQMLGGIVLIGLGVLAAHRQLIGGKA